MPLFRIGDKLVYFAHVPRCAGTAVEDYMIARFGQAAFLDRRYLKARDGGHAWNLSSPQHIPVVWLDRLFPPGFFDAAFCVVRHPVDRLLSVFQYQRDKERKIGPNASFSGWLGRLEDIRVRNPFVYDNHARAMTELVPPGAKAFRLEDGLDSVVDWLDGMAGNSEGPRTLKHANARAAFLPEGDVMRSDNVTASDRNSIARMFAADFERFEYV